MRSGAEVCLARAATLKKWLFVVFRSDSKGAKVCRSRQELSNEYLATIYLYLVVFITIYYKSRRVHNLLFTCKICRRYNRERVSQSLPKIT